MKLTKFIILPIALSLLSACPASDERVHLHYGSYTNNSTTVLRQPELASKVSNKESFIVVVSPGHQGCMCWHDFKELLDKYISTKHVIVYEVSYNSFFDKDNNQLNTFGLDIRNEMETFAFFEKGSLKKQEVYSSDRAIFKQYSALEEYINQSVVMPKMYYVSLDNLNTIYESKQKAVIYFARNNCPDCQAVDTKFLMDYTERHSDSNKIYILDGEAIGIREYDENGRLTPESSAKWQEFKDNYGLSNKYNTTYGYTTGVVPTFQLIEGNGVSYPSSIISSSVFFNDEVEKTGEQFMVSESFYTEERMPNLQYLGNVETKVLKGKTLTADDVNEITYGEMKFYSWKQEKALQYHSPLLEAFLDYALPLTGYNL